MQVNVPAESMEQKIFAVFHAGAITGREIVVTLEMKDPVDDVTREFDGPWDVELACLELGLFRAKEDFAVEFEGWIFILMVESDDVRGAIMLEPVTVEFDHPGDTEQMEAEGTGTELQQVLEQVLGRLDEGRDADGTRTLAVKDPDLNHAMVLPRCSS
jgi:hypothetical protein